MKASIVRRLAVALAMIFFFLASAAALAQNAANGQVSKSLTRQPF